MVVGGVFSSKRCCLAPLKNPAIEEAEETGADNREEAVEVAEEEEGSLAAFLGMFS